MANNVFINSYIIRVKKRFVKDSELLNSFEEKKDLFSILGTYFLKLKNTYSDDPNLKTTVYFPEIISIPKDRIIYGLVQSGEYGFERKTLDISTRKTDILNKTKAVLDQSYFLLSLPKGTKKGIALFCRYKSASAFSTIQEHIEKHIIATIPSHKVCINPLFPRDQVEKYLNYGHMGQIQFVKHSIPPNIEDKINEGSGEMEGDFAYTLNIKPSKIKEKIFAKVLEYLNADADLRTLYEFTDFNYDKIIMDVNFNGRKKKLDITDLKKIRSNIDISSSVTFDGDGNPSFASLHSNAVNLLTDLRAEIGN